MTEKEFVNTQPIEKDCFHPDQPYVVKRLVKTSFGNFIIYLCKSCVNNPIYQGEDLPT